jgi:hypothetical protein
MPTSRAFGDAFRLSATNPSECPMPSPGWICWRVKLVKSDGSVLKASVPAHSVVSPEGLPDQWRRLTEKASSFAPAFVGDRLGG